jgi:chromosomal replication initiator protein
MNQFRELTLENLLSLSCDARGIPVDAIKTKCRKREITEARFAFFILAKDLLGINHEIIGEFVDRGHCDVSHALKNLREIPSIDRVVKIVKSIYIQ